MKSPLVVTLASLGSLVFGTGCPSDDNPAVLWLALDGSELQVKLVDEEPQPF
jgi:hypothetical protein